MSLVVATYVPEGIVMASDSRQSIKIAGKDSEGKPFEIETINSDSVIKTFCLEEQGVGISNFGQDLLGGVPMGSHIKRFAEEQLSDKDDVESVAKKLFKYFSEDFPQADCGFHISGYKKDGKVSVPFVFHCHVGRKELDRKNLKPDNSITYGATWSGQADIISSLIKPIVVTDQVSGGALRQIAAPILWDAMSLQDAVDFSVFAIKTTIDAIRFQARPKNVGGPINVLVITPDEIRFIKKKELVTT